MCEKWLKLLAGFTPRYPEPQDHRHSPPSYTFLHFPIMLLTAQLALTNQSITTLRERVGPQIKSRHYL